MNIPDANGVDRTNKTTAPAPTPIVKPPHKKARSCRNGRPVQHENRKSEPNRFEDHRDAHYQDGGHTMGRLLRCRSPCAGFVPEGLSRKFKWANGSSCFQLALGGRARHRRDGTEAPARTASCAYHTEIVCWSLLVRPIRAQWTKGSTESTSVDPRTGGKKCAYLAEWHGGGRLGIGCWIDELGLLRAVETYVKTPHRRPANFMICRDITHGRSEKRANRGNGL